MLKHHIIFLEKPDCGKGEKHLFEQITIGTYTKPQALFQRLNHEFAILQNEGFPYMLDVDRVGEFTFLDCFFREKEGTDKEDTLEMVRNSIANCLAEIIIEEWETLLLKKIVRDNFYYYTSREKQAILSKTERILNPSSLNSYYQKQRKEEIRERILDYLARQKKLIIEGFINFRLKDYQENLSNAVDSAVDEFLLEKEYREFIRLLRYFVEIQEPRIKKVQVVFKEAGKFIFLDEADQLIEHESLEGLCLDFWENEINYADLLISALITLAPEELLIHQSSHETALETIETIKDVFRSRVKECSGCEHCQQEK